jgi:hypothetical protein
MPGWTTDSVNPMLHSTMHFSSDYTSSMLSHDVCMPDVSTREDAEDIVLEVVQAALKQPELSRLSEEKQLINVDAVWSPDGKYIAIAEGTQSLAFDKQSYVVKVWVA